MNLVPHCSRALVVAVLVGALASCSKDQGARSLLGPDPGSTNPPPGDADGYFVNASTGHDDSAGTKAAPFRTIRRGIEAARSSGVDVFVAKGSYVEASAGRPFEMRPRVSVYGGYDGVTWQRDPERNVTEIVGTTDYPAVDCIHADSLAIDGFTIRSPDQPTPGLSAICIRVAGVAKGVVISNNKLFAGRGSDGVDGRTVDVLSGAGNGGDGAENGFCPVAGGTGGTSASGWPGGDGGQGGAFDGYAGGNAPGSDATFGQGGAGGTLLDPSGRHGKSGRSGSNGGHGKSGAAIGNFPSYYIPGDGTDGTPGAAGRGGGGGGGAYGNGFSCGAGGGGGGGGGRGGGQGTHGGGGGGSFGILVTGDCTVHVLNNAIVTGNGGKGGDAGIGASGHAGGPGLGGYDESGLFAAGGNGGTGGNGGNGGWGGPGGGGPSIAIVEGPFAVTTRSANVITLGSPGAGGTTEAAGQPNAPAGIAEEYRKVN